MGARILGEPGEWVVDGGTKEGEVATRSCSVSIPDLDSVLAKCGPRSSSAGNMRVVRGCINSSPTSYYYKDETVSVIKIAADMS